MFPFRLLNFSLIKMKTNKQAIMYAAVEKVKTSEKIKTEIFK
jgi:hypothetical protein